MRIFLVGFMGCGKSKTGKRLAKLFDYKFIDTDRLISSMYDMRVHEIFKQKGEEYFRNEETKALKELCKLDNIVVSTGGGTPCFNDNMKLMNENGITVYLIAGPGLLYHRLAGGREHRPLIANLNDEELKAYIVKTLEERSQFYEQSKVTVKAQSLDLEKMKAKILRKAQPQEQSQTGDTPLSPQESSESEA